MANALFAGTDEAQIARKRNDDDAHGFNHGHEIDAHERFRTCDIIGKDEFARMLKDGETVIAMSALFATISRKYVVIEIVIEQFKLNGNTKTLENCFKSLNIIQKWKSNIIK